MRLTPPPILFVLFHYPRGGVTTDNTRDKTSTPFSFVIVDVNRRGLHLHSRITVPRCYRGEFRRSIEHVEISIG